MWNRTVMHHNSIFYNFKQKNMKIMEGLNTFESNKIAHFYYFITLTSISTILRFPGGIKAEHNN